MFCQFLRSGWNNNCSGKYTLYERNHFGDMQTSITVVFKSSDKISTGRKWVSRRPQSFTPLWQQHNTPQVPAFTLTFTKTATKKEKKKKDALRMWHETWRYLMRNGLFNDFKEKCSDRSVTMIVDSSSMLQCNRIQPQPQGTHVIVSWELLSVWESSVSYFLIEAKCIDVWQCESPRLRAGAPRCPPAPTLGQVLSFPTLLNLFHASVWHRNSLQSPWKVIVGSFVPGQWKC